MRIRLESCGTPVVISGKVTSLSSMCSLESVIVYVGVGSLRKIAGKFAFLCPPKLLCHVLWKALSVPRNTTQVGFLGPFSQFCEKANIKLRHVCPNGTTRLPLDGFS
jgi:hypothetical protein